MAKKAALGKGLSALLPQVPAGGEGTGPPEPSDLPRTRLYSFEDRLRLAGRVAELELDAIQPNPYQPRTDFREEGIAELAASIEQLGIIQPLTVRALGAGRFELISGERRLRAARRAGLAKVPAFVREADTEAMLEMAIVENVQREDLNPIEVALGYQRLIDEVGLTQEEVAQKVGKNRSTVANAVRLLRLPPRVQAGLRDGSLSAGHARQILALDTEEDRNKLLRDILDKGLSVRETERRVREAKQPAPEPAPSSAPEALDQRDRLEVRSLETRLRDHLATQVQIKHKPDHTGRIEISYYSREDLERLLDLLEA